MGRAFQVLPILAFVGLLLLGHAIAEDMLFNGDTLNAGDFIENGPYQFIMQTDCNLVLYVERTRALWNSGTNGRGTTCRATLQNNGNLVVLLGNDVIWTSNSAIGPNNYRLIVQSDGNVSSMVELSGLLIQFRVGDACSEIVMNSSWRRVVCVLLFYHLLAIIRL